MSAQKPMRWRTLSPISSRSAASSSKVAPSEVPVPAVVSSSTMTSPGTSWRQRVITAALRFEARLAIVDKVARMGDHGRDAERVAAPQLGAERLGRPAGQDRIRGGEVD